MSDPEPSRDDWDRAFSRQAVADYRLWSILEAVEPTARAPLCQRLMLLQMACEKLCKAHTYRTGSVPKDVQSSHAQIAKRLPAILREVMRAAGQSAHPHVQSVIVRKMERIGRELELLNPAVDDNGRRPDNCEYPWQDGGVIRSPLDYAFVVADLLRETPFGPRVLKLLKQAFEHEAARHQPP